MFGLQPTAGNVNVNVIIQILKNTQNAKRDKLINDLSLDFSIKADFLDEINYCMWYCGETIILMHDFVVVHYKHEKKLGLPLLPTFEFSIYL
jgi:hypothetical protein